MKLYPFANSHDLAQALAKKVAADLRSALAERLPATLIVSGGSTPKPMFEALSHQALAWNLVQVTLADERWVAADDPASNERLVRRHLMRNEAATARFRSLKNDAATPSAGVAKCQEELAILPRPYDVVVLGMGDDGHFASLFPGAGGLEPELGSGGSGLVQAIEGATPARVSLTLAALLSSRRLYLHITGEPKRAVLEEARQAGLAGQERLPVAALLAHAADRLQVYWAP